MRVRTTVEADVDVDIPLDDVIAAIADLGMPESAHHARIILNLCVCAIKKIPDDMVTALTDAQREIIAAAMEFEAARYRKVSNVELTGGL